MKKFIHFSTIEGQGEGVNVEGSPVVWVPGEAFACHLLTVPPVSQKKWQAMIPWLLEEHILEQPETLVFASAKTSDDNRVAVVAASCDRLDQWRQALEQQHQSYSELVPDFFALPWREGQLSVAFYNGRCLVRFNRWQGAAGAPEFILPLIKLALVKSPGQTVVYFEGQKPQIDDDIAGEWQYEQVADLFCPVHSDWIAISDGVTRADRIQWSLPARIAAGLVVVAAGLLATSTVLETRQMTRQTDYLHGELRRGYRHYFGEQYDFAIRDFQRVVSARMEASAVGEGGVMGALAELSGWLGECSGCELKKLEVNDGDLIASLSGEGVDQQLSGLTDDPRITLKAVASGWQLAVHRGIENE